MTKNLLVEQLAMFIAGATIYIFLLKIIENIL